MKYRGGFVSNSSSSSFIIMGALVKTNRQTRYEDILKTLNIDYKDRLKKYVNEYCPGEEADDDVIAEFFYEEIQSELDKKDIMVIWDGSHVKDGYVLIGKVLVPGDDYGVDEAVIDLDAFKRKRKEAEDLLGEGYDVKLYAGSYPC